VDGDLLIGTLTVERETINIVSGKALGGSVSFSLRHREGRLFTMRGTVGERGLEGDWESGTERGRWRGARVK
jgi:hypothetical protein